MEKSLLMHIGTKVRKLRELKGYSQEYVASQLNMVQTNYSKIERCETKGLLVERLVEIAKVLEVDPATILNFDDKQVLNNTSNNQGGGYSGNIMYVKESFERERTQYEARIQELKEESTFLKEEIAFLRETLKNKK